MNTQNPVELRFGRSESLAVAAIVCFALLLFSANVDFRITGDMAMYVNYAMTHRFDDLTLHLGYYWLLSALSGTVGAAVGLPLHEAAAWANVACGAATLGIAYLLAYRLLLDKRMALLTVLLMGISGRVISNATSGEIYMLQTLLVLSAMLLFSLDRPFLSGILAGFGLLVSPLSAFAYLFFPAWLLTGSRVRAWETLGWLILGASVVYLPFLAVNGNELFFGRRGLLRISSITPIQPRALVTNVLSYQFKHYTATLLLLIPAWALRRSYARLLTLAAAVAVPHAYVVMKLTSEDNTFLLSTDFFFAAILAMGIQQLLKLRFGSLAAASTIIVHLGLLVSAGLLFSGRHHRDDGRKLRMLATTYLVGKSSVLLTDWSLAMTTTFFGRDSARSLVEEDPLFSQMYDLTARADAVQPSLRGKSLYLLETWSPGFFSRVLRSNEALERIRLENSMLSRAESRLGVTCKELSSSIYVLYACDQSAPETTAPTGE